ncbi:hypothetical protein ACLOJK_005617, partial [Asimina triloba]
KPREIFLSRASRFEVHAVSFFNAGKSSSSLPLFLLVAQGAKKESQSMESCWDFWVEQALWRLDSLKVLRSLRPISLSSIGGGPFDVEESSSRGQLQTFDGLRPHDRASVEIEIEESTFKKWVGDVPSPGDDTACGDGDGKLLAGPHRSKKLLLFSGNDYLGLSSHPAVRRAAANVAQKHGMGPRGSALICGYTNYHRRLESSLADLKKKEECLLCPTGFAANIAIMVTLGSISSLLAAGRKPLRNEKVAIFSDALNHASIIDGIRLAERQQEAEAHGTLVCGEHGGGVAEEYGCEHDVDICIGTLSKAAGCHGGFIACRLRITLSAAHTIDDLKKLTAALSNCIKLADIIGVAKL